MLLKLKREVEEIIEVKLPMFVDFAGLNKIVSETEYIEIMDDEDLGIRIRRNAPGNVELLVDKGRPIDEAAFNNAYQKALSKLNALGFNNTAEPATEEDLREGVKDDIQEATKNFVEL